MLEVPWFFLHVILTKFSSFGDITSLDSNLILTFSCRFDRCGISDETFIAIHVNRVKGSSSSSATSSLSFFGVVGSANLPVIFNAKQAL